MGLRLVGSLGTVLDPTAVLLVLSVRKWSEEQCSLIFHLRISSKNYMKCSTYRGTVHDSLRTDIAIAASRHLPIPVNRRQLNHYITKNNLYVQCPAGGRMIFVRFAGSQVTSTFLYDTNSTRKKAGSKFIWITQIFNSYLTENTLSALQIRVCKCESRTKQCLYAKNYRDFFKWVVYIVTTALNG